MSKESCAVLDGQAAAMDAGELWVEAVVHQLLSEKFHSHAWKQDGADWSSFYRFDPTVPDSAISLHMTGACRPPKMWAGLLHTATQPAEHPSSESSTLQSIDDLRVARRLMYLTGLPTGWDEAEALPPKVELANRVRKAVAGLPVPYLYARSSGAISAEWDLDDRTSFTALFQPDEVRIFAVGPDGAFLDQMLDYERELPTRLLDAMLAAARLSLA